MDSNKNTKPRPLLLEERHTKSLEVSKEIRRKVEQSMFIPRAHSNRKNLQDEEKRSKKLSHFKSFQREKSKIERFSENTSKCSTSAIRNSKNTMPVNTPITRNNLNSEEPGRSNYGISKIIANENLSRSNKFCENTSKCSTFATGDSKKKSAAITRNILSAEEPDKSDCRTPVLIVNENSADSAISISGSDILIEDTFKTEIVLNSLKGTKITSTDLGNTKHTTKSKLQSSTNLNRIDDNSGIKENIVTRRKLQFSTENSANRNKDNNFHEKAVENKAAESQIENTFKTINLKSKKRVNPPVAAKHIHSTKKLKGNHYFNNLFHTDLQSIIRDSLCVTKNGSSIEAEIMNDIRILDNLAENFSQLVLQVHKDLDDQTKKTQNCVEYARKLDAERKLMQPDRMPPTGHNQPNSSTAEIPETFTIFIEADILPKKSITFQTSDIFNHNIIPTNKDVFYDDCIITTRGPADQSKPKANLEHSSTNIYNEATTKYPPLPSINISPQNWKSVNKRNGMFAETVGLQKSKHNLQQTPKKSNPPNVPIQSPTTAARNFLNSHFNQMNESNNLPDEAVSNYYSCRPETNSSCNSWLTQTAEQWSPGHFNPHFESFNRAPTVEMSNEDFRHYQYPPITFLENHYLQPPLIESHIYHTLTPNSLPAYEDIQLRNF